MKKDMINLKGVMCLGSDFELALNFGRGLSRSEIERDRENMSFVAFAQNYLSIWVGVKTGALVDIGKLNKLRTLKNPHNKPKKGSEYVISVDVARSEKDSNNQTSIVILELKRKANGRLSKIDVVNLINLTNGLNYSEQGLQVKRIVNLFHKEGILKALVVDGNIIGKGLIDELMKETFDPETGDSLGCYDTINTEQEPEVEDSLQIIYDLKAQSIKGGEHLAFINAVDSNILRLLERKENLKTFNTLSEIEMVSDILPFANTDLLINEVSNLKLKETEQKGVMKVEQQIKRIDKDRYSALSYGLWYCFKYEDDKNIEESGDDISSFILMGRGAKNK